MQLSDAKTATLLLGDIGGTNARFELVDADIEKIKSSFSHFRTNSDLNWRPIFGDGKAAEFICDEIVKHFGKG